MQKHLSAIMAISAGMLISGCTSGGSSLGTGPDEAQALGRSSGSSALSGAADTTTLPSCLPTGSTGGSATATGNATAGLSAAATLLRSDLEDQISSCWDTRNAGGSNTLGCGPWTGIGAWPAALSVGGIAHSGGKSLRITYARNEEAGGSTVNINSDTVNVRSYYYFDTGFDFGQGVKIGRVSSFNVASQMNDMDIILVVRSVNGANQCGINDMKDLGVYYNGRPVGYDWGNVGASFAFQRNRWYAVEYQVILNTPGSSDGAVRLWVDGVRLAERTNVNIRGSLPAATKLNRVRIGGWYSNSAYANPCPNPSAPSRIYMDDVVIAKAYVGLH